MFPKSLAALAVAALVASVAYAAPPPRLTGPITLVATVREHHTIHPEANQFPGRETWFFSLASVRRKGKPFGYAVLACTFASVNSSLRQCTGTYSLPRGKIIVAGAFLYPTLYELAVTGGTGAYSGVGGNLSARQFIDKRSVYWITVALR